jgi:hypothetical protein
MKLISLTLCALLLTSGVAQAEDVGTLTSLFDNDLFNNRDRHYTNGVALAWTTAASRTPNWLRDTAHALPLFSSDGEVRATYAVGQSMFTPDDIRAVNPPLTDRPYAGFLYAGLGLSDRTDTRLDQVYLQLGVVGPSSLTEDAQDLAHSIFSGRTPEGWAAQLHDEPIVQLTYQRSFKLIAPTKIAGGLAFDLQPHIGVSVGNAYDYVNAGGMMRIGYNLPNDFGPLRVAPGVPGSNIIEPTAAFGAYLFAGVDGRAMARNIFLDGNTWRNSRSVDKRTLVGDMQAGAALVFRAFTVTFTQVLRTKEFRGQDGMDRFGAMNVSLRF